MRLTRDWGPGRSPLHCCILDRDCWQDYREFYMPLRLYFHFIHDEHGHSVWINLWGRRRFNRWLATLHPVELTTGPRGQQVTVLGPSDTGPNDNN